MKKKLFVVCNGRVTKFLVKGTGNKGAGGDYLSDNIQEATFYDSKETASAVVKAGSRSKVSDYLSSPPHPKEKELGRFMTVGCKVHEVTQPDIVKGAISSKSIPSYTGDDPVKVMTALANLSKVRESLQFLVSMNIVQQEAVLKGCKKFVNEHPEINEHFANMMGKSEDEEN